MSNNVDTKRIRLGSPHHGCGTVCRL